MCAKVAIFAFAPARTACGLTGAADERKPFALKFDCAAGRAKGAIVLG